MHLIETSETTTFKALPGDANNPAMEEENTLNFSELLKNPYLLLGLEHKKYFRASLIQALVCNKADPKRSCVIQAKAGTGKTLAFSCASLERFTPSAITQVQILVVTPTHEVSQQVADIMKDITRFFEPIKPSIQVFIGGQNLFDNNQRAKDCHIAVGTPGRLSALIRDQELDVSNVETLIFDEADRLMNHIFIPDLKEIYEAIPSGMRLLAASATFEASALSFLEAEFLPDNSQYLMVDGQDVNLEGINQFSIQVQPDAPEKKISLQLLDYRLFEKKTQLLIEILTKVKFYQAIVFLNKESRSSGLVNKLDSLGWPAAYTSGKTKGPERLKAMAKTRSFVVRVLVCSDLIARGVDVDRVDLVINLDMPPSAETYLHRVGRTGRFGTKGVAVSLVGSEDEITALNIFQDSFKMPVHAITNVEQINDLVISSRKLQREDVLAFTRLKAIREKRKDMPENPDSISESNKLSKKRKIVPSPCNSPIYTPQSPSQHMNCPKIIHQEASIETAQYSLSATLYHENPFFKFWREHFGQR